MFWIAYAELASYPVILKIFSWFSRGVCLVFKFHLLCWFVWGGCCGCLTNCCSELLLGGWFCLLGADSIEKHRLAVCRLSLRFFCEGWKYKKALLITPTTSNSTANTCFASRKGSVMNKGSHLQRFCHHKALRKQHVMSIWLCFLCFLLNMKKNKRKHWKRTPEQLRNHL